MKVHCNACSNATPIVEVEEQLRFCLKAQPAATAAGKQVDTAATVQWCSHSTVLLPTMCCCLASKWIPELQWYYVGILEPSWHAPVARAVAYIQHRKQFHTARGSDCRCLRSAHMLFCCGPAATVTNLHLLCMCVTVTLFLAGSDARCAKGDRLQRCVCAAEQRAGSRAGCAAAAFPRYSSGVT
jgi:hypothetical protein